MKTISFSSLFFCLLCGATLFSINTISAQGTIRLEPNNIESKKPSSYIVGIQRNHIFSQVKNQNDPSNKAYADWFSEMLNRYGQIQPQFGNGKKLYRLGGNQIDGMISTMQEKEFKNPTQESFIEVANTCRNEILAKSKTKDVFGNGQIYRVYKDSTKGSGPHDQFIYFENADYKGYHWADWKEKISNKSGNLKNYGQYDDLKYYTSEAKAMDADLTVTVNFSSGTPSEAISMVAEIKRLYNGDLSRLQFLELGNEVSEPYIKGNRNYFGVDKFGNCVEYPSKSKNRKEYAHHALDFAFQLRKWLDKNGGKHVKIGVVGTTNSYWAWNDPDHNNGNQNLETLLIGTNPSYPGKRLLDYIDFVIYHSYPSYPIIHPGGEYGARLNNPKTGTPYSDEDMAKLYLAQTSWNLEKRLDQQQAIIRKLTKKDIRLANSEYYSHINQVTRGKLTHSITEGIYTADNMIAGLKHNMHMAVNFAFYHFQDHQNEISDNLLFDVNKAGQIVGEKPVFAVHKLIAEELGTQIICATDDFASNNTYDIDISNLSFWKTNETNFQYKPLNYIVTTNDDGDLILLIVNRSQQSVPLSIESTGFRKPKASINSIKGNGYTDQRYLKAGGYQSINSLKDIMIPGVSANIIKIKK